MRSLRLAKKFRPPLNRLGLVSKRGSTARGLVSATLIRYFLRAFVPFFDPLLLLGRFFAVLLRPLLLPLLTDLPLRPSLDSLPASMSCSYAPRTTLRATFSVLASSRSLGNNVPAASSPASIKSLSCSRICRVMDSGLFRLTRTFSLDAIVNSLPSGFQIVGVHKDSMHPPYECQTVFFSI